MHTWCSMIIISNSRMLFKSCENDTAECCFESALFLSGNKQSQVREANQTISQKINQEDFDGLICSDLLFEINKSCKKDKALIDITQKDFNFCSGDADNAKKGFAFPDGGWVCSLCQNYNFYGRTRCNRCNKKRTKEDVEGKPDHLRKLDNCLVAQNKKEFTIRDGDWICPFCYNFNFAFREECNKCKEQKNL